MKVWEDEFGADADGRRGITQMCYELEDSDKEDISKIIIEDIYGADDVKNSYELEYDDLVIEVDLCFCKKEVISIIKEDKELDKEWINRYINKIKEISNDK